MLSLIHMVTVAEVGRVSKRKIKSTSCSKNNFVVASRPASDVGYFGIPNRNGVPTLEDSETIKELSDGATRKVLTRKVL